MSTGSLHLLHLIIDKFLWIDLSTSFEEMGMCILWGRLSLEISFYRYASSFLHIVASGLQSDSQLPSTPFTPSVRNLFQQLFIPHSNMLMPVRCPSKQSSIICHQGSNMCLPPVYMNDMTLSLVH